MRKLFLSISLFIVAWFFGNGMEQVFAAVDPKKEVSIDTVSGGELKAPSNTKCRKINFDTDEKRTYSTKITFVGNDIDGTPIRDIYDLCIGSFPNFPSTSVEGGMQPYFYLKYRLIPDPMPVYKITTTPVNIDGNIIVGLKQTFEIDKSYEAKNRPSDEDIYVFYPYDKSHVNAKPVPKDSIRGPYQIGYNNFYHNTYRGRFFASQVKFEFNVLEPFKGSSFVSQEGKVYQDKTVLFSGEIIYDIPESCFETEYLDYKDECREIEFYFPKGTLDKDYRKFSGEVQNTVGNNGKSKNVIPKNRLPYMNPGEHELVVTVKENTQLRVQKDYGTEFQTVGNPDNIGNLPGVLPYENYVVYFGRQDKYIEGANEGKTIQPLSSITQNKAHKGKSLAAGTIRDSGKLSTTSLGGGEYTYDPTKNTDWLNYCEKNTDQWGNEDDGYRKDNSSKSTMPRDSQSDTVCYHNDGADYHFWEYNWSDTTWYAKNPKEWLD